MSHWEIPTSSFRTNQFAKKISRWARIFIEAEWKCFIFCTIQETQQVCSVCQEVIEGTYYQLNDQVFCEKDYMGHMDKCAKCDKDIDGHAIRITGSVFHSDCFNCEVTAILLWPFFFLFKQNVTIKSHHFYANADVHAKCKSWWAHIEVASIRTQGKWTENSDAKDQIYTKLSGMHVYHSMNHL